MLPRLFFQKYSRPEYFLVTDPYAAFRHTVYRYDRFPDQETFNQWGRQLSEIYGPDRLYVGVFGGDTWLCVNYLLYHQSNILELGWGHAYCFHNFGLHIFSEGSVGTPCIGGDLGRIYPIETFMDIIATRDSRWG
jgi:hypothetical protein